MIEHNNSMRDLLTFKMYISEGWTKFRRGNFMLTNPRIKSKREVADDWSISE